MQTGRTDTVASNILDLSEKAATPFFRRRTTATNGDSQKRKITATLSGEGEDKPGRPPVPPEERDRKERGKGTCSEGVWTAISNIEGDITRFTRDVSEAGAELFNAVEYAGETAEHFCDGVGSVTDDVLGMSSDEAALTALLVQRLTVGGGPSPDEVMSMVRKCEEDGRRSQLEEPPRCGRTAEDLVIPGSVFLVEGGAVGSDARQQQQQQEEEAEEEGSGNNSSSGGYCLVRRIKSRARGIRLSSRMVDDHFMDAYELAMEAAARRYFP